MRWRGRLGAPPHTLRNSPRERYRRGGTRTTRATPASRHSRSVTGFRSEPGDGNRIGSPSTSSRTPMLRSVEAPPVRDSTADPYFEQAIGHASFASLGQQAAVRSVELSPDGSTLLVSLPTGTGKSAVGLYGALRPEARGTTVVVVPTVSLAMDQRGSAPRIAASWLHRTGLSATGTSHSWAKQSERSRRKSICGFAMAIRESCSSRPNLSRHLQAFSDRLQGAV